VIYADYPQSSISKKRKKELEVIAADERLTNIYNKLYTHREPYPILTTNLTSCTNKILQIKDDFDFIFIDVTGTMNHPIEQTIRPVSNELVDAHLFFNRIPRVHKIGPLLNDLQKHFAFFPFFLNNYVCYERAFRSTVFP